MRKKDGKVGNKTVRKKIQIESQKKTQTNKSKFCLMQMREEQKAA